MKAGPRHVPVLKNEIIGFLCVENKRGPKWIMDCTLGLGGHAGALLENAGKDACLIGMDADEGNVILSQKNLAPFGGRVRFFHANFSRASEVLKTADLTSVDALVADLGFSSSQVDEPSRGMSFRENFDGPLDMRYDRQSGQTAADIVNTFSSRKLADLIREYGEERFSGRIASAIVEARGDSWIDSTARLAGIVTSAVPPAFRKGPKKIHPATRTFQALRIAVNDELENLRLLLESIPSVVGPGGRAAIISFHSLEDRMVKESFKKFASVIGAAVLTKKPVTATGEEIESNVRSRSAKLRVIEI